MIVENECRVIRAEINVTGSFVELVTVVDNQVTTRHLPSVDSALDICRNMNIHNVSVEYWD